MTQPTVPWHRLTAFVLILAAGLAHPTSIASEVGVRYTPQEDTTDLDSLERSAIAVPKPELSPSTDKLFFEELLPDESRTLFMDLVNLGEGVITLDSLIFPERIVQVILPLQTLSPGQFIRFPVTYTQVDLDTHEIELDIHWQSPEFNLAEILTITLMATPKSPLIAAPPTAVLLHSFVGAENTTQVKLHNTGTRPITFTVPPVIPVGVKLSPLPQILVGETSVTLTVTWIPEMAGLFNSRISLPYRAGNARALMVIGLQGEAIQAAYLMEDTLTFGSVIAGNSYHQRMAVGNRSERTVILDRRQVGGGGVEFTEYGVTKDPLQWIEIAPHLEVVPGDTAYIDLVFSPLRAGLFQAEIPFIQQFRSESDYGPKMLPDLMLPVRAEVVLPLTASTAHVNFGLQPVLETAMQSLAVTNQGTVPLSISLELERGEAAFSTPPLVFGLAPGEHLDIPLYFRPFDMRDYSDTAILHFAVLDEPQEFRVSLSGSGLDQPLLRLDTIPAVTLMEDFPGWYPLVDLTKVFADANHQISYRISNPFGENVELKAEDDGWLRAAGSPDYHGTGSVIVEAVNELEQVVADTFLLAITPVNDLPRLVAPLPDMVLIEDATPSVIGRLSEIFIDPDHTRDTVITQYTIYSLSNDDTVSLVKREDDLVLAVTPDWHGSRSFVVSARDASDTSAVVFDRFKVTVLAVNDPPTLGRLPGLRLMEDDTAHVDWRPYVHDVDDSFEDLILRFMRVGGGSLPLTFEREGPITVVRPRANWFGKLAVRLKVTDQAGAASSRDFAVSVIPENDPPGLFLGIGPDSHEWEERLRYTGNDTLITFEWAPSPNLDPDDDLVYTWQLLDITGQQVLKELPAGLSTDVTAHLDTTGIFRWTVLARDSEGAITSSDTLTLMLESMIGVAPESEEELAFSFGPNYPNPFSDYTHIVYTIPRYSDVVITMYDAMGRKVKVLHTEPQYRGRYVAQWDGRDDNGQRVASGPYVAEIQAGANTAYLKLVVVH
ncbi:MAG: T9SS type A sorting domain-containing protein [Fidelibacterota bacterium]|nr:MAG: T9SS type A sorting domain-containing protein [Candidatus Neomarinimicrobiota bacterium]